MVSGLKEPHKGYEWTGGTKPVPPIIKIFSFIFHHIKPQNYVQKEALKKNYRNFMSKQNNIFVFS